MVPQVGEPRVHADGSRLSRTASCGLCARLLDPLVGPGGFDFVEDVAGDLPPTVILALLGFPEGIEEEWRLGIDSRSRRPRADGASRLRRADTPTADRARRATIGIGALFQMLPDLLAERRGNPGDDLMSVLVNDRVIDDDGTVRKLTDEEIFSFVLLLSAAGTETVARLLGWAGCCSTEHPDERDALVADPSLIPNAVEELLRYEAPSPVNGRWVTADVELHGPGDPEGLEAPDAQRVGETATSGTSPSRALRRGAEDRPTPFVRIRRALLHGTAPRTPGKKKKKKKKPGSRRGRSIWIALRWSTHRPPRLCHTPAQP